MANCTFYLGRTMLGLLILAGAVSLITDDMDGFNTAMRKGYSVTSNATGVDLTVLHENAHEINFGIL